jgi:uncharacterized protein (TIGR04255 family)
MAAPDRQTQKLPISISPCPIIDATFDIWFEAKVPPEAVFGLVYQAFCDEFPACETLAGAYLTNEARDANPAIAYQPGHRMMNENVCLLIGPRNFAVGMRGEYPGWQKLSSQFIDIATRFDGLKLLTRAQRFGLKYINFFSEDVLPKIKLSFGLEDEDLKGEQIFFRTLVSAPPYKLLLQAGNSITLPSLPNQIGSVIDIDAFSLTPDTRAGFNKAISAFLEGAHAAEKSLFYRLLSQELLASLNPVY